MNEVPSYIGVAPLLSRADLLSLEGVICAGLREFFPFSAHSFYFPRPLLEYEQPEPQTAEYIARERKLLLPLRQRGGEFLGFFAARLPQGVKIRPLLPFLPNLAGLCLDKAALYRQSLREPVTGLHSRQTLLNIIAWELERLGALCVPAQPRGIRPARESARAGTRPDFLDADYGAGKNSGQFSLLLFRLDGMEDILRAVGHLRLEELLTLLGNALEENRPGHVLAARSGEDELAVLVPGGSPRGGEALGLELADRLGETHILDGLSGRKMRLALTWGLAYCPPDLQGMEGRPPAEQARRLLRRARLAADLAAAGAMPGLTYAHTLLQGGRVLEPRPFSRLLVSPGSAAGARPGQVFTLWGQGASRLYKADIRLVETDELTSLAEILHLDDPAAAPEAGDHLRLHPAAKDQKIEEESDFLPRWSMESAKYAAFALILGRFSPRPHETTGTAESISGLEPERAPQDTAPDGSAWEERMRRIADKCREILGQDSLLGRYALNSLIFFVPDPASAASPAAENPDFAVVMETKLQSLASELQEHTDMDCAFGLALHPFLDFHKADALENARKALRYALLLPAPGVGRLGSLALNINADRLTAPGVVENQQEAVMEYRRALLCDPDNTAAGNSLGALLFSLGRADEAERVLRETLRRSPTDFSSLYNLGTLLQARRDFKEAGRCLRRCLDLQDDRRPYALQRLGQMDEQAGNPAGAEKYYRLAGTLPGGVNLSRRGLARLAAQKGRLREARELLHETLLSDPHDAIALYMLAGLYLDAGEDPAVAESLARRSAALRPDLRPAWMELARSLEAGGKKDAAREALIRAGES
ncbi:MAG: tetratricopeptide repeat protein [Deltaproteobacteria bacterium]|nr:tetratricopeptide repeat protein [Deltaproteobacteria bacterium]